MPGESHACGTRPPTNDRERPADDIEVTLFRQILLVPFAIEVADGTRRSTRKLCDALAERLGADPERRWERLREPLFHLPEDRLPDDLDREKREKRARRPPACRAARRVAVKAAPDR